MNLLVNIKDIIGGKEFPVWYRRREKGFKITQMAYPKCRRGIGIINESKIYKKYM